MPRRLLLILMALAVACTPARKKVRGDVVRRIKFEGNGGAYSGHNDYQLRKAITQEASAVGLLTWPMSYFVEPALLNRQGLVEEAYRLEVWYAHHGWFDARMLGWRTERVRRSRRKKAGVVNLVGRVDPGAPSLVRSYTVEGATGATASFARELLRTGYIREGQQFDLELAQADRARLESTLRSRGYAYARVELRTDAYPEERAVDVVLDVTPGIIARFGPVRIEGNDKVPTRFIEQNVRIQTGAPYRLDGLKAAQNRLFQMGTFSLVRIEPDLSDPTRKEVPIAVRVNESRFRILRLGVGGVVDFGTQVYKPNISLRFRDVNIARQLIRFDGTARAGFLLSGATRIPTWELEGAITYPRIFGQKVAQQLEVQAEQDADNGLYRVLTQTVDFRSIWRPSDVLVLQLGPHVEQVFYPEIAELRGDPQYAEFLERLRNQYGNSFQDRFRITSVDLNMTLDWRDDPLSTKRGSFFAATTRFAFPLEQGDFTYFSFLGDWRLFRPIRVGRDVPLTLATRVHGKLLVSFQSETGLPYRDLFAPGGANSHRGFPSEGMGPYEPVDTVVTDGDQQTVSNRFFFQQRGNLGAILQEELRYYGPLDLTYAAFVDVGTLIHTEEDDRPGEPITAKLARGFRVAGGVGVRYASPLGPIRLDLAVRPRYYEDFLVENRSLWGTCGEPGSIVPDNRRRIDLVHTFDRCARGPAVMLFLAFGEAI